MGVTIQRVLTDNGMSFRSGVPLTDQRQGATLHTSSH
jgi:hypothetical protein